MICNALLRIRRPALLAALVWVGGAATLRGAAAPITRYQPPPDQAARAIAYSHAVYLHSFVNAAYGFLVLLGLVALQVGPRLRAVAERRSARRFAQVLLVAPAVIGAIALCGLVSDVWDQRLALRYGLSVQSWGSWLADWVTDLVLMMVVGSVLVWVLYGVLRRAPRNWWFYFWLASLPIVDLILFAAPLVVEPLFYTFKPLAATQPALVAQIENVTRRGGMDVPVDRMFLMNASAKQTGLNAYVSGFGASKRVVVWDTTVAKATIPETLFVFAHEMGHYVLHHIPYELGIFAGVMLVLLWLGAQLARRVVARWGPDWGVRGLDDLASLPLLLLIGALLGYFATPVFNAVSRHFEHEADRYGLEVIHGLVPDANQVAARYFEKSGEINLSDPDPSPFIKAWFFDHPPRRERVHFAATYDPWAAGAAPRYVK